jgi:hypothetical protein
VWNIQVVGERVLGIGPVVVESVGRDIDVDEAVMTVVVVAGKFAREDSVYYVVVVPGPGPVPFQYIVHTPNLSTRQRVPLKSSIKEEIIALSKST